MPLAGRHRPLQRPGSSGPGRHVAVFPPTRRPDRLAARKMPVTTPDTLATLWQPTNLHTLETLAQQVADCALASENPESVGAIIRFCNRSFQLQKRLEPFTQHDLDQPNTWPSCVDHRLLHALLRLRS